MLAVSKSGKGPRLSFGWEWNGTSLYGIAAYVPHIRSWTVKNGGGDPKLFPPIQGIHTMALGHNALRYTIDKAGHISASGVAMESRNPVWLFASGTVTRYGPHRRDLMEEFLVRETFKSL